MKGKYKLAIAKNGICHYAKIEIELIESKIDIEVDYTKIDVLDMNWLFAAKQGIEAVLLTLKTDNLKLRRICKLEGTLADTTSDGIWLAAALATIDALKMNDKVNDLSFIDGIWIVNISGTKIQSRI